MLASWVSGTMTMLPNKGLQLTKAARCAPFAFRSWGQSLRAAFAAEARCSADPNQASGAGRVHEVGGGEWPKATEI